MDKVREAAGLDALIDWLEAAAGLDRELDISIACAVFGLRPMPEPYINQFITADGRSRGNSSVMVGRFTESIDAARMLVPEGFKLKLGYSRHAPCVAELVDYRPQCLGAFIGESDSNHAIALCIAALRARAVIMKEGRS